MARIIKLRGTQSHEPENILATDYYLCSRDENGKEISRQQLTGDEHISTVCPKCNKEFRLDFYDFCNIVVTDFDFYGTSIYCCECSAKRIKEQEAGK